MNMGRRGFGQVIGRGMLGVALGSAMLVFGGCSGAPDETLRYKMIVEVDTPQGIKTGSAVRQLDFYEGGGFMLGEGKAQLKVKGEAVAVDIAPGKTLFALLAGADGYVDYAGQGVSVTMRVMDRVGPKGGPHELWPRVPVIREPITDPLPMLVTFTDISDPKSVVKVGPADLAATFGAGVTLRRITVQVTDEKVTTGIGERLVWLGEYYAKRLDGQRFGDGLSFANSMSSGTFSTEANK